MRLAVDGETIEAYGEVGGPILFLHGAGQEAGVFAPQLRDVSGSWAIDLPGHGRSPGSGRAAIAEYADFVLRLLARHAEGETVLAGHSMGGAIAIQAALQGTGRLAGLAVISASARMRVHPDLLRETAATDEMPARFADLMTAPGAGVQLGSLLPPAPGVLPRDFLACDGFDVRDRLGEIRLRALVMVGEQDNFVPPTFARAAAEGLHAELVVVEGAGHMLTLEAADTVSRTLSQFLIGE